MITGPLLKNKYPSKIIVHCKDLRVFQYCLTYTDEKDAKKVSYLTFAIFISKAMDSVLKAVLQSFGLKLVSCQPTEHAETFQTPPPGQFTLIKGC